MFLLPTWRPGAGESFGYEGNVAPHSQRWIRTAYFVAGCGFVVLAVLGIVLPLLPTTPFVLLASSCFVRSSPRAQRWLLNSRWFGPTLRNWIEHRAVSRGVKLLAFAVASIAIVAAVVRDLSWGIRVPILILGAVGLIVVWRLPVIGNRVDPKMNDAEGSTSTAKLERTL